MLSSEACQCSNMATPVMFSVGVVGVHHSYSWATHSRVPESPGGTASLLCKRDVQR
ncbi:hypothetical protein NDU88_004343 [Pleurodeles waltl]|uniref:Uncharacterized protein n=1 Tax=Pleurodeles waltl TaxID=8319 RepID=A0AAV7PGE2_PLEWA|nr:hypothetical protein NDU88_004343 [Pleurodeles waltl]